MIEDPINPKHNIESQPHSRSGGREGRVSLGRIAECLPHISWSLSGS